MNPIQKLGVAALCAFLAFGAVLWWWDSPGSAGGPTSWSEAEAHVGEEVEVCGPLRSVGHTETASGTGATFINVGVDYPSKDRFTFIVWTMDSPEYLTAYAEDSDGVRVCGSGEVTMYKGVAEIVLESFDDLEFPEAESVRAG